jgi:hypothetical protein
MRRLYGLAAQESGVTVFRAGQRLGRLLMLVKLPHPKPASAANVLQAFRDKLLSIAKSMRLRMA